MVWFALRRTLAALPVICGAVIFTFVLTRLLPGDPAANLLSGPGAGAADIAALRHQLGVDSGLPQQLLRYSTGLAHGDWGNSFVTGQPVLAELLKRLPASLELTGLAFVLSIALGLPLGVAAATRPGGFVDQCCRVVASLGTCLPTFVVALAFVYLFYVVLGWAPEPTGRLDPLLDVPPRVSGLMLVDTALAGDFDAWRSAFSHLLLPACAMALFGLAPIVRTTRSAMLDALASDAIRTARSLRLPRRTILLRYALRGALLPILTTLGMVFSYLLGANVVIEKIFTWPGIGSYALDALLASDYAPVQGFVLLVALLFALVNLLIDLLYGFADPRVRLAS
ncbi:ABC transporter permease [Paraburkholderia xenovorans]|uniref:ABC transporter permease n=1 Tax=Paraburkholderia xenovorans TaxID=36873 RepID=UPI0038BC77CB